MKKIGLALGGGGARGLCHIAFCRALDEMGLKPAIVSGTSIGSIVGAFYAGGLSGAEMAELAEQIGILEYTKMIDFSILRRGGLVKGKNVMAFLERHLPVKTFEALSIPMKVVATDFWHRKQIVIESGDLLPAIRASISIPGLFEPVKIGSIVMTDGGAVNPLPMSIIREACDILIAIDVSGTNVPPKNKPVPSIFESILTTFQIMETAFVENELRVYRPEIYIKPKLENVQILDFHRYSEIMNSVGADVERLKRELDRWLEKDSESVPVKKKRFIIFGKERNR